MIAWSVVLLILGVFLSAFFSGSETGFYRASRVKVVMAGLDGARVMDRSGLAELMTMYPDKGEENG